MSSVFIDTNVLYNVLFRTALTARARRLLEKCEDRRLHTSLTVINELLYVATRKHYQNLGEARGTYSLHSRYHGIGIILTFDEDFTRVPWLRVVS